MTGNSLGTLFIDLELNNNISSGLLRAQSQLSNFSSSLSSMGATATQAGRKLSMCVTAPLMGMASAAAYTSMKFEDAMLGVKAVSQATGEEYAQLTDLAEEMGLTTRYSAAEAAEGMKYLAMAGFEVEEIMASLPDMLNLAAASNTDLGTTADIASNILTGFGLDAEDMGHAADVMALAVASSNTDLTQLGEAMSYAAPIADMYGMSIEETAAAVGFLSNAGIQGSMAGTTLRGMLARLSDPTDKATQAILACGVSIDEINPLTNKFTDIIRTLTEAGVDAAVIMELMGQRAGPGTAALISQGYEEMDTFTTSLENSDGAAEDMAETMESGFGGAIRELKSALEGLTIAVGNVITDALEPYVDQFSEMARSAATFVSDNPALIKQLVVIGAAVAAAGPALLALGGGLTIAGSAFSALSVVMGPFIGIFGGVSAAIGALGAGLGGISLAGIVGSIVSAVGAIGSVLGGLSISGIVGGIGAAIASIGTAFASVSIATIISLGGALLGVVAAAGLLYGAFKIFTNKDLLASIDFEKTMVPLRALYDEVKSRIMPMINTFADFAVEQFQKLLSWWDENGTLIIAAITPIINTALDVIETALPYIIDIFGNLFDIALDTIKLIAQLITGDWSGAWNTFKDIVGSAFDIVKDIIVGAIDTLGTLLYSAGKSLMDMFKTGIVDAAGGVVGAVSDLVTDVDSYLTHSPAKKGPLHTLPNWDAIFEGLEEVDAEGYAKNAVSGIPETLATEAPSAIKSSGALATTNNYSGGDVIINVQGMTVRSDNDIKEIAKELHKLSNKRTRAAGV